MISEASPSTSRSADAVVVGSGIGGLTAALTVAEAGHQVTVIDSAARETCGGNTRWSVGIARIAHSTKHELIELVGEQNWPQDTYVADYPVDRYLQDLKRVTRGAGHDGLQRATAEGSYPLARWLAERGVRWEVAPQRFGRDPERRGAPPGLPDGAGLMCTGGGEALVETLLERAAEAGVDLRFCTTVRDLHVVENGVHIETSTAGGVTAPAVILAAGSFEADAAARARYLGAGWDLTRTRGTRHNTGRVLEAALRAGAQSAGHWSAAHSVAFAPDGPTSGDAEIGDVYGRYAYPYGITVNMRGERFFDEGADQKNFTYSSVGQAISEQPGRTAFQLFDAEAEALLEPRYASSEPVLADDLHALATMLDIPPHALRQTVDAYNAACRVTAEIDPHDLDGVACFPKDQPPKSNWAAPLRKAPFRAYRVVPAITFAFGGLAIDLQGHVTDTDGMPLSGIFACGDIVGGLAAHGLPAGTGMIAAGVQGITAGRSVLEFLGQKDCEDANEKISESNSAHDA